jgi:hypothetical protein
VLLFVRITGFMFIENLSLEDSIYFSVVTMATVGYGDIHPLSPLGKILALILIVGGVGTFLGVVARITDILLKRREESFRRQKLNMIAGLFFSEIDVSSITVVLYETPSNQSKTINSDFNERGMGFFFKPFEPFEDYSPMAQF